MSLRLRTLLVPTLAAALLGPVALGPPAPAAEPERSTTAAPAEKPALRNLTKPRYDTSTVTEYRVPTPYGTIYGWVRRPDVPEGRTVPTILTYSPYAALSSPAPGVDRGTTSDFFVPRGYARAYFHLVGTANSGGCYDYGGVRERETARRVVDFLGTRDWSNGKVGMIGGSYDGTTQWAAAVEQPEHLTTIVPQVAISRWYDYAFGQGVRFASGTGTPLLFDVGFNQVPIPSTDLDPAAAEALVDSVRPCETLRNELRGFGPDPVYDGFWKERDYRRRAQDVEASVLLEGSWADYNVHPINSEQMWQRVVGRVPALLRMSQQGHGVADFDDSATLRHAWFDRWLLGRRTGVMAQPVVESRANTGLDSTSAAWPPATSTVRPLTLGATPGAGDLGLEEGDSTEWADLDPQQSEQRVLDGQAPLTSSLYVGDATTRDVRIAGTPRLDVRVRTSAESTHLTPVLFDEAPDGTRIFVSKGLLNSRNRDGLGRSEPLAPGEAWSSTVVMQPTDHVLAEGHRLGLAMMSMNADEAFYGDETAATNELLLGGTRLRLPTD
ncbi:CocE/NonD family hydrolase [Nocardioides sp. CFH 31398]|uniref:CocE/NonD family hydrolase n=1 Tax=Nocardioides sp. CFH 31398 TaxID=2919579 RepID=UPI001F053704|nr:CocE/NonD family hydrolase [Nocardioides sp. CFH 31398]MCH1867105.1 CocE/NonD family hydrolase [Nocardioides sp. CFH 31398]